MPGFLTYLIPGLNSRASLMLDVVFLAMLLVVPALALSIQLAKRRKYLAHKVMQVILASVLLIAVTAFEVDMRFYTDWRALAQPSPYYASGAVLASLWVHLAFAIPTLVLWIVVTIAALRKFDDPPQPGKHSRFHRRWGMFAAYGMFLTAVTGWVFYYLAFVA